jgi:hypothetical protein
MPNTSLERLAADEEVQRRAKEKLTQCQERVAFLQDEIHTPWIDKWARLHKLLDRRSPDPEAGQVLIDLGEELSARGERKRLQRSIKAAEARKTQEGRNDAYLGRLLLAAGADGADAGTIGHQLNAWPHNLRDAGLRLFEVFQRPEPPTEPQSNTESTTARNEPTNAASKSPSGQPDSKTDNRKKIQPDNEDVSQLCRLLKKRLPKGDQQIQIALEFTRQNREKAESLLRQARRFRHLWQ